VNDAPISATGVEVVQLPNVAATGLVVATFTDKGGSDPVSVYTATINWGDGSASTAGTIAAASGGGFRVTGSHTYALPGVFPLSVAISDKAGSTAPASNRAVIGTLNQQYVAAVFESLYGRPVDPSALAHWTSQLDSGVPRTQVIEQLTHTDEYFATIIRPAYLQFLGRPADPGGLAYWTQQMHAGLTDEQLMAQFIGSPEYFAHTGGTNAAWVTAMYNNLLGRAPDAAGLSYWVGQLAKGASRSVVAQGFAQGPEHEAILVRADYTNYLGRSASPSEVAFWVNAFTQGVTNEDVVSGFVGSDEYFNNHTTSP
jgi:hypothetical protein